MQFSRRETDSLTLRHHNSSATLLRAQADAACEQMKRTNDFSERKRLDELCQRLHHEAATIEKAAAQLRAKEEAYASADLHTSMFRRSGVSQTFPRRTDPKNQQH
jgi:hypothetical protein